MAVVPTGQGITLTPHAFITQWRNAPHKFQVSLWNFEVKMGKIAQEEFQKSFDIKRFNSNGSTVWAARKRRKDEKKYHPLMYETGSLKNSIKWKHAGKQGDPNGVIIYTDPNGFTHTNRHKGFCYAAVHNGPDSYRTGSVKNMPRRQFMGYSTEVKDDLIKSSVEIFKRLLI